MRVTVGAVAVLGLAVTVATGQPGKERAAALKTPEPLASGDLPPVARGAIDDFPPLSSTPVPRSNSPAARTAAGSGPAWLTGADPNVVPAAGSSRTGAILPLASSSKLAKDDSAVPPPPKMLDRIKGLPGDKSAATPPQPVGQAAPTHQQPQPTASTPFRGTGANGAPVFAGPPAYRWYGWGTVTPGANPLAPAGQYPKASANWYSITGATPGAFPVPVSEQGRVAPGTEPPTYGLAARQPGSAPVTPITSQPHGQPYLPIVERPIAERPEASRFTPPETKFIPGPGVGALPPPTGAPSMPVSVPTLTPPPVPKSAAAVPSVPPAPASAAVGPLAPPAAPSVPPAPPKPEPATKAEPAAKSDPVAVLPPPSVPALTPAPLVPSVAPAVPVSPAPVEPVKAPAAPTADAKAPPATDPKALPVAPAPLPTSVTADPPREEQKWQQSKEPAPRPGTWAPAAEAKPLPTVPVEPLPSWQTGAAKSAGVVARAQRPDNTPDPIATLIKQVCQGRAEGVEIRFTGTKKLQVCFEVRGADAAKQLVSDISKRSELTAYQIDFCVVVK